MKPIPGKRAALIAAFILVAAGILLVSNLTFDGIRRHEACPPTFDEAVHLLPVLGVSEQLSRPDVLSFLRYSYAQDDVAGYPFFHSWLAAPFLLISPESLTPGRFANLLFVALSIVLAFILAKELSPSRQSGWLAALAGAGLLLAAMPLWAFAGRVFLEPLGLLLTLAVLICYVKASPEKDGRFWLLSAGLLTAAALFTKYSFGLFLVATLVLAEAILWLTRRKPNWRRWLYLFGPLGLMALLWFGSGDKLRTLWLYSRSQNATMPLWSLESLSFYVRSLAQVYAPGWPAISLMLLGIAYAVYRGREHRYRAMLVYLFVGFLAITLVAQKDHRFAYTVAPAALILGGVGAAWLFDRFDDGQAQRLKRLGALIVLLVLLSAGALLSLRRFSYLGAAQEVVYQCPPEDIGRAYAFVLENSLNQGDKPYILNSWHRFNRYSLMWGYGVSQNRAQEIDHLDLASSGLAPSPTGENLDRFIAGLREQNVDVLVSIDGSPAGDHTAWSIVEPLWGRGDLEWLDSSETYRAITFTDAYKARALGGDFRDRADFETARADGLQDLEVQLHLYTVVSR